VLALRIKRSCRAIMIGLFLVLCSISALADPLSFSFALTPTDGAISGTPGSTIGWGYAITNSDLKYGLLITDFGLDGSPGFDSATAFGLFDFPVLDPDTAQTEQFDPLASIGFFQIVWDASATIGLINTGNFFVTGQFFDPLTGDNVGSPITEEASYTATVVAPVGTAVPEPSSLTLLSSGLIGIAAWVLKKKR
jgi:hypothetical protein